MHRSRIHFRQRLSPSDVSLFRKYLSNDLRRLCRARPFLTSEGREIDMNHFRRLSIQESGGVSRAFDDLLCAAGVLTILFVLSVLSVLEVLNISYRRGHASRIINWPSPDGGPWSIAGYFVALIVAAAVIVFATRLFSRLRYRGIADSSICLRLVYLVGLLADEKALHRSETRRRVVRLLEHVAFLLEHEMPRQQAQMRQASGAVFEHYLLAAQHLRSLEIWIAIPQSGTRESLQNELSHAFWCSWDGRWHDLCTAKPAQKISKRSLGKAGIVAFLPLAVFATLLSLGLGVGSAVEDWVFLFSSVWAVVKIVSILDPGYSTILVDVKNLVGSYKRSGS